MDPNTTSTNEVLAVTELLEQILQDFPMRELFRLRRISHRLNFFTTHNRRVRQQMYLESNLPLVSSPEPTNAPAFRLNALLGQNFPPGLFGFATPRQSCRRLGRRDLSLVHVAQHPTPTSSAPTTPNADAAFYRKDATWRDTFVFQPPSRLWPDIYVNLRVIIEYHPLGPNGVPQATSQETVYPVWLYPDITMGQLLGKVHHCLKEHASKYFESEQVPSFFCSQHQLVDTATLPAYVYPSAASRLLILTLKYEMRVALPPTLTPTPTIGSRVVAAVRRVLHMYEA